MKGWFYPFLLISVYVVSLFGCTTATAQSMADSQRRYAAAVKLVQSGNYERAKSELNAILQERGPLAPYANYYYALAAFRQRNFTMARASLRQLIELFPNWRKRDEASYLLAAACLESGQYEEALKATQSIKDQSLQADVTKLEQTLAAQITDLNRLKKLNQLYPNNKPIGLALIESIQRSGSDKNDLELSDRLTNRFGVPGAISPSSSTTAVNKTSTSTVGSRKTVSKGYYNVAVMFPFRLDDFASTKRIRSNQYVYDLYDGIKLAKNKLQEEGITINLFAYDVDNDANKTLELVNSPSFSQIDLVIGPLYVEPNRIVSAYANQNNILLVNPIATSNDLVTNQPWSFLAQPSMNQQAIEVAELAKSLNVGRKAAIYFGASRKDSLLASAYLNELTRQNYQIADFRKLTGTAQSMAAAMTFAGPQAQANGAVVLNNVFFASSNEEDGGRILDALSRRKISAPLIATASAFDFYHNSSSTFTRRDLYLLYPDFVDSAREPVMQFQDDYLAKRNTIPSVFTSEGYDMMLYFGRLLAKNGTQLRNRANLHSDTDDYLLSGFDYTKGNENQTVPIVKYNNGHFVKIN